MEDMEGVVVEGGVEEVITGGQGGNKKAIIEHTEIPFNFESAHIVREIVKGIDFLVQVISKLVDCRIRAAVSFRSPSISFICRTIFLVSYSNY